MQRRTDRGGEGGQGGGLLRSQSAFIDLFMEEKDSVPISYTIESRETMRKPIKSTFVHSAVFFVAPIIGRGTTSSISPEINEDAPIRRRTAASPCLTQHWHAAEGGNGHENPSTHPTPQQSGWVPLSRRFAIEINNMDAAHEGNEPTGWQPITRQTVKPKDDDARPLPPPPPPT